MRRINDTTQLDSIVNASAAASEKPGEGDRSKKFISIQSASDFLEEGKKMPPAKELVPHVLVEGEITFLYGGTGIGKSAFAMQLANEVAEQGHRVLVVNFELAQQQLAQRYPNKQLSNNLYISCINYEEMNDVTDQTAILADIVRTALDNNIDVLVIDNFTNLCINSKEGSEAGNMMLQLLKLRMEHKWTMLVLAHVPKRKPSDPLTIDDMAGSKQIANFADNVIGLNKSKKDKNMRYLIQQKYRSFPIELDSKNVQELTMTTSDGWLHFERGGYSEEVSHLPRSRDEKAELERDIVKELQNGLSYRDIIDKLGTSMGTVQRVAQSHGFGKKTQKATRK